MRLQVGRDVFLVIQWLTIASGSGQSLQQVVLGRVLAGVGGAGIHCLVSIVIAGQWFYVFHCQADVRRSGSHPRGRIVEKLCQYRSHDWEKSGWANWRILDRYSRMADVCTHAVHLAQQLTDSTGPS